MKDYVAATSVGMVNGELMLDLNYEEDAAAEVDMNVVMTSSGKFVEIQGTAEARPFSHAQMDEIVKLAAKGVRWLIGLQKKLVKL